MSPALRAKRIAAIVADVIGPRVPGMIWRSGYWQSFSLVLAVESDSEARVTISEVCCDASGTPIPGEHVRRHGTDWDAKRDRVVGMVA